MIADGGGRVAIITGASRGIGAGLAEAYCNAGVFLARPFVNYTQDDYELIASVNTRGFFHVTRCVISQMLTQGEGHIINVTTALAEQGQSAIPSALTALTKGGLVAATKSLAIEYASRGIRVNAISPGVIDTPMHDGVDAGSAYAGQHPQNRIGAVADIVHGALYLENARFVTGEILHIDGGQSAGH
jgi:NAD(P)-dependent dehydrogenase (short-subunit alcohol dehydrogenase family)